MSHVHECCRCGYVWPCSLPQKGKQKRCEVAKAVVVNKDGPYCLACHHDEMARRHREFQNAKRAEVRGA